jgi:hypothetical protein
MNFHAISDTTGQHCTWTEKRFRDAWITQDPNHRRILTPTEYNRVRHGISLREKRGE